MYLIFDTETTGLPKKFNAPVSDLDNWPRCVQIAWQLHDYDGSLIEHNDFLIKPENYDIPYQSEKIHGISTALAKEKGFKVENQGDLGLSMRTNDLSVNFMKKGSAVVVGPENEEDAITLFKSLLGTKSISV